ncbi:MAG: hypothetical protein JO265_06220, partial [Acidimicrobiia bacterium]|nr:hypothetical protein [Acidimicrobiia bacterium]
MAGAVSGAVLVAVLAVGLHGSRGAGQHKATAPKVVSVLHVDAAAWRLPVTLSRAVAFSNEGRLLLAGGLTTGNKTLGSMLELDPRTGAVADRGVLAEPVHDAAGAELGAQKLVFGGGAAR